MDSQRPATPRDDYVRGVQTEVTVARTRAEVARLHGELVGRGLVSSSRGSVSARVPGADLFVTKPAGIAYDALAPENMVVCTLQGRPVEDTPGAQAELPAEAATVARIFRDLPDIGAIVHTSSTYAAAWAARGEEIPCVLSAIAGEFGGAVPVGPYAPGDADADGATIVRLLGEHRSRAVLLHHHGAYVVAQTADDAVALASVLEDVARTAHIARQPGPVDPLGTTAIDALYERT